MSHTKLLARVLVAASLVSLLAVCGRDPGERALSGAGIGAGAGALGGALMGSPATGAIVGGAAGAAAGGLTSQDQFDLGEPIWK